MNRVKETGHSPPTIPSEEALKEMDTQQLLVLYQETGAEDVKWQVVLRYTGLIKKIASQARGLFNNFAQLDDVIHEGILVLSSAVEKFDPSMGTKFETYISKRLRGMIIDLARKQDWVPRQVRQNAVRLNRATEELSEKLGYTPSSREMAEYLGVDLKEYEALRADTAVSNLLSFEVLLDSYGSAGVTKEPVQVQDAENLPEEACMEKELHEVLAKGIGELRENEQLVLSLYYEQELNMKEIAQVLGVSAPRVSQIHSSALQHLRSYMENYMRQ